MAITLTYATTTIELDPDLYWSDELSWQPVEQTAQRTVTGAMVISTAARVAGRPITLQPDDESSAWMSRADLDTLTAWASVPGRAFILDIRDTQYSVIFRHHDGAGVEASPVMHFNDVQSSDWYRVTLRFMEQ